MGKEHGKWSKYFDPKTGLLKNPKDVNLPFFSWSCKKLMKYINNLGHREGDDGDNTRKRWWNEEIDKEYPHKSDQELFLVGIFVTVIIFLIPK
jgi:hypothetical protein